jgi:hypothetical protein
MVASPSWLLPVARIYSVGSLAHARSQTKADPLQQNVRIAAYKFEMEASPRS